MHIQDSIIQAYLQDTPFEEAYDFSKLSGFKKPTPIRKEVVEELNKQLHQIVQNFPVFNTFLWKQIFTKDQLDNIVILPVVGSYPRENKTFSFENSIVLQIDLLLIADYTPIVSQMCYILKNYITVELAKILLMKQQAKPLTFLDKLDQMVYIGGIANYLAWNEDCSQYVFSNPTYDKKKEEVFGLLYQVQELEDIENQTKLLTFLKHCSFWENFPAVAGMFYLDDIYHEKGMDGMIACMQRGSKCFIKHIFEE